MDDSDGWTSVRTKLVDTSRLGSTSSIGDWNSSVGARTASTPKPVVTTNIQPSRRTIRSVDTWRAVLAT